MTLWPISMLSRIFDSASAVVPASQAGGRMPSMSSPRPATSRPRWARITPVMYSASRAPRSATTRARIASSSSPKASSWSGVSVGAEADMVSPVVARGSEVEGDVADRDGHADAHHVVVGRRDLAGQDVAHGSGGLAAAARVADAHAAAEVGREARVLGLLEQRQPAVGRLPAARGEADDAL